MTAINDDLKYKNAHNLDAKSIFLATLVFESSLHIKLYSVVNSMMRLSSKRRKLFVF